MESFSNYFEVNLFSQFWTYFFFFVSNDLHVQESFYLFIALNWINALFELRDSLIKKFKFMTWNRLHFKWNHLIFDLFIQKIVIFKEKKIQFNNLSETLIQIKYLNMKSILNSFTRTLNRNEFVFNITDERKKKSSTIYIFILFGSKQKNDFFFIRQIHDMDSWNSLAMIPHRFTFPKRVNIHFIYRLDI